MSLTDRVSCPFDPVHVIERRRLQVHIVKCLRNLPHNHDFVQCHFWHLHYVRRSELKDHLETCEHRMEKESNVQLWTSEPCKFFQPKLLVDANIGEADNMDSWDIPQGAAFEPERLKAEAKHMTIPEGLSKSRRKEFFEKERERLRKLEETKPNLVSIKEEKVVDELPKLPRKPAVPALAQFGRIAAKFPAQVDEDSNERKRSSPISSPLSFETPPRNVGRGRGTLGDWSAASTPGRDFHLSPSDFPVLKH